MREQADAEERFEDVRAQRDALRQELGDLRAWLSVKLGYSSRNLVLAGLTVLSVASDREIIAKIEELTDKHEQ
ncbi:hypothetical protein [Amycolatopsis sp. NPDC059657]|uniref:hypothetical protein n=1 Tax=Amycolatopsis sp. NPDC059657 TaxID=3346899 RepID=UPI003670DBDB